MSGRFRIRTAQGQELSFASQEMFAEFVRSGDLSPDDVVYDAESKEWSSARTHPVVLQIELDAAESGTDASESDREGAAQTPQGGAPERSSADGPATADVGEIGLDLAPAPAGLTPEEESAAFVARMEAERAADLDFDEELPIRGLRMEKGSATVSDGPGTSAPPPEEPVLPQPVRETRRERERVGRAEGSRAAPNPPRARPAPPKRRQAGGPGRRYAPFLILGVVVIAAGVYLGPGILVSPAGDEGEAGPGASVEPPPPAPLIPDTEEALRARARERFLTVTQAALRGLEPIPAAWLSGAYLAAPSDYPRVREVWEDYLTTMRQIRDRDDERYRQAYLRALDDARIEGATRTMRLARAIEDFQAAAAPRAAHYDRVEALALAAIGGHDALVQAEGTIMYQPARGPAVSGDPVIEAVGRDPNAQALLNEVLDVILERLQGDRGAGEIVNVREWVWDGLLDAVTN